MDKKQISNIIGKQIRQDTYLFIKRIIENNETYEQIYNDLNNNKKYYGIKEDTYLTKKKTIEEYVAICRGKVDSKLEDAGVYGIYVNDIIIYVGETVRSFQERFTEHYNNMQNKENKERLYSYLRNAKINGDEIIMRPLITLKQLKNNSIGFTHRDLLAVEYGLIQYLQPIMNIEGNFKKYRFNKNEGNTNNER